MLRKPTYTLAELARAAEMFRSDGAADTRKVERLLKSLGVPVRRGRPRRVFYADLHRLAPALMHSFDLAQQRNS